MMQSTRWPATAGAILKPSPLSPQATNRPRATVQTILSSGPLMTLTGRGMVDSRNRRPPDRGKGASSTLARRYGGNSAGSWWGEAHSR
jgi:hypothetical protein